MPRKPVADREEILVHPIIIRVNDATYKRLEKLLEESSCKSIGEVARKILTGGRINCFYRDVSLNGPMEELALIRKELKFIGININQQTRYFNAVKSATEKQFHSDRTVELYLKADAKMERLFALISKLAEKWLQKS
ncbi:MAG: mobilization protein [Pedobacter sp.]|nr:MAG: mobilization protein [Pedobacter sp.]